MGILHRQQATEGQGLAEYALIIVLVAVAIIGTMVALGGGVNTIYTFILQSLADVGMT